MSSIPVQCQLFVDEVAKIVKEKDLGIDEAEFSSSKDASAYLKEVGKQLENKLKAESELTKKTVAMFDVIKNSDYFAYHLHRQNGNVEEAMNLTMKEHVKNLMNNMNFDSHAFTDRFFHGLMEDMIASGHDVEPEFFRKHFLQEKGLLSSEELQTQIDAFKVMNNLQKDARNGKITNLDEITTDKVAQGLGKYMAKIADGLNSEVKANTGIAQNQANVWIGKQSWKKIQDGTFSYKEFFNDVKDRLEYGNQNYSDDIRTNKPITVEKKFGGGEKHTIGAMEHMIDQVFDNAKNNKKGNLLNNVKEEWKSISSGKEKADIFRTLFFKDVDDAIFMHMKYGSDSTPLQNFFDTMSQRNSRNKLHDHFGFSPMLVLSNLSQAKYLGDPEAIGYQVGSTSFVNKAKTRLPFDSSHNVGLMLDTIFGRLGLSDDITAMSAKDAKSQVARIAKSLISTLTNFGYIGSMSRYVASSLTDGVIVNGINLLKGEKSITQAIVGSVRDTILPASKTIGSYPFKAVETLFAPFMKGSKVVGNLTGESMAWDRFLKYGTQFKMISNNYSEAAARLFQTTESIAAKDVPFKVSKKLADWSSMYFGQRLDAQVKADMTNHALFQELFPRISEFENISGKDTLSARLKNKFGWTDKTLQEFKNWQSSNYKNNIQGMHQAISDVKEIDKIMRYVYSTQADMNFEMSAMAKLNLLGDVKPDTVSYEVRKAAGQLGSFVFTLQEQIHDSMIHNAIANGLNTGDFKLNNKLRMFSLLMVSAFAEMMVTDVKKKLNNKKTTIEKIIDGSITPSEMGGELFHGLSRSMFAGKNADMISATFLNNFGNNVPSTTLPRSAVKIPQQLASGEFGKAANELQKYSPIGGYDFEKQEIKPPYPIQMLKSVFETVYNVFS